MRPSGRLHIDCKAVSKGIQRGVFLLLFSHIFIHTGNAFAMESSPPGQAVAEPGKGSDIEKTVEDLKNRFDLFPYDESIRKKLIQAYAAMGEKQMKMRLYDGAAESFENARKLSPDDQTLSAMKGIALYGGKHYDAASVELEQARRNGGDTFLILFFLGRTYYDKGDLADAIDVWNSAEVMEPGNKTLRDLLVKARKELSIESRMGKDYGANFVISYDEGNKSDLADKVLDVLATAYNRVGYDFSHYPEGPIPVILYTRKDYRSVTSGPEWSGGMYDGKVRLPIGGATDITPVLRGVLVHEYTHVVVGELTGGNCPVWLNEGLAEYEGRKEFDSPLSALESSVKNGSPISFAELEKSFTGLETGKAALAYQQSYSLVNYMISAYGMYKVRDVLVNLGKGMESGAAIAAAFADFRLDFPAILQEWRDYIRKKYGSD